MKLQPHPDFAELLTRFRRLEPPAGRETGLVLFRSVQLAYAAETDLLSGEGSALHGGRWNPPGLRAVYGSFSPETALAEALATVRHYGIPPEMALPRVLAAFRFRGKALPDLTDQATAQRAGTDPATIEKEDWREAIRNGQESLGQATGRAAAEANHHGLIVPSSQTTEGKNALLFPREGPGGPTLEAINAKELPKNAKEHAKMLAEGERDEERITAAEKPREQESTPAPGREHPMTTRDQDTKQGKEYPTSNQQDENLMVAEAALAYGLPRIEPVHPAPRPQVITQGGKSMLEVRARLGMTRARFLRLLSISERALADIEGGKRAGGQAFQRRLEEITRLADALESVMKPEGIGPWLETPNEAFGGHKPIELIERGEIDRLWEMVFYVRSGVPG